MIQSYKQNMKISIILSVFFALIYTVHSEDVIVQTKYGKVRGVKNKMNKMFYGIPYAAPPVGPLRWKPPLEPEAWLTPYNATERKAGCPQKTCEEDLPPSVCPTKTSEDCLYMNIWAPATATNSSMLPVMVFIHGGNFVRMSGSSPLFDGQYFTWKGNVILVNFDYRIGTLGFLYTGNGPDDAKGNYGIQDQRSALLWIKDNIKSFGGNPDQVTLFGESAGAQSTIIHLMSEKSAPYFQRAIVESSPFSIPYKTRPEALFLGDLIAELLNCTGGDMTCLRSKSADEIATAQKTSRDRVSSLRLLEFFEPLGPFIDGDEVPMQPIEAAMSGMLRDVPIMLGTTTEESRIYVYTAWKTPLQTITFEEVLLATFLQDYLRVASAYLPRDLTDNRDTLAKVGTDFLFTCSTRNVSRNLLVHNFRTVYLYAFDHAFSFPGWGNFTCCVGHVCHGSEVPYVFHSAPFGGFNFTADEEVLSNSMIAYWTNFASTSDPNTGPLKVNVAWPLYGETMAWSALHFQTPNNEVIANYQREICDFWDTIGYKA